MGGGFKMLRGVLVLGGIAAAHMAAAQTETKMHPTVACLQTLLTTLRVRRDGSNLIKMRTRLRHGRTVITAFRG